MKIGDTFVWCPTGGIDHLWIVISDPTQHDGDCVLVNLTESRHGAHSFTLRPGQHRYIYKDSDVNFGDAFRSHVDEVNTHVASGSARPHDPMDMTIVREIIKRDRTHPCNSHCDQGPAETGGFCDLDLQTGLISWLESGLGVALVRLWCGFGVALVWLPWL